VNGGGGEKSASVSTTATRGQPTPPHSTPAHRAPASMTHHNEPVRLQPRLAAVKQRQRIGCAFVRASEGGAFGLSGRVITNLQPGRADYMRIIKTCRPPPTPTKPAPNPQAPTVSQVEQAPLDPHAVVPPRRGLKLLQAQAQELPRCVALRALLWCYKGCRGWGVHIRDRLTA